jgi:hypothetical protein
MGTTTARLGRAFRKLSWLTSLVAPSVRGVEARPFAVPVVFMSSVPVVPISMKAYDDGFFEVRAEATGLLRCRAPRWRRR